MLIMGKNVHSIEILCSPAQTLEDMPLCFEDPWANTPILRGRRLGRPQETTPMPRGVRICGFRARSIFGGGLKISVIIKNRIPRSIHCAD